jgi:hypothetical protein
MHKNQHRRGPPSRTATVITFDELPASAQSKGRGHSINSLSKDDLSNSQRSDANSNDIVIIQDGDTNVVLSPTGDAIEAIQLIIAARA